jgi:hypothetical protein
MDRMTRTIFRYPKHIDKFPSDLPSNQRYYFANDVVDKTIEQVVKESDFDLLNFNSPIQYKDQFATEWIKFSKLYILEKVIGSIFGLHVDVQSIYEVLTGGEFIEEKIIEMCFRMFSIKFPEINFLTQSDVATMKLQGRNLYHRQYPVVYADNPGDSDDPKNPARNKNHFYLIIYTEHQNYVIDSLVDIPKYRKKNVRQVYKNLRELSWKYGKMKRGYIVPEFRRQQRETSCGIWTIYHAYIWAVHLGNHEILSEIAMRISTAEEGFAEDVIEVKLREKIAYMVLNHLHFDLILRGVYVPMPPL